MKLCVTISGRFGKYFACKKVPDYQQGAFQPLKTCDDPMLLLSTEEISPNSEEFEIAIQTRLDVAKDLASELVPMIVDAMKQNDIHNGFEIGKKNPNSNEFLILNRTAE